jgi:hypothetical protein
MESGNNLKKPSSEDLSTNPEEENRKKIYAEIKELEERLLDCKKLEKEEIIKKIGELHMRLGEDHILNKEIFGKGLTDN